MFTLICHVLPSAVLDEMEEAAGPMTCFLFPHPVLIITAPIGTAKRASGSLVNGVGRWRPQLRIAAEDMCSVWLRLRVDGHGAQGNLLNTGFWIVLVVRSRLAVGILFGPVDHSTFQVFISEIGKQAEQGRDDARPNEERGRQWRIVRSIRGRVRWRGRFARIGRDINPGPDVPGNDEYKGHDSQ